MVDGLDVQMGKGRCKWVYAARQRYATLLLGPYWGPIRDPWAPIGGSPWNLEVFRCGIHLTPTTSSLMHFGYLDTRGVNPKRKSCGRNNGQGRRLAFVAHVRLKLFCATCKLRGLGTPYAAPSNRRAGTASRAFSLGCDLRCAL